MGSPLYGGAKKKSPARKSPARKSPKKKSPARKSPKKKSPARKSPNKKFSTSPTARARRAVVEGIRDVDWTGRGPSNRRDVIQSIRRASGFDIDENLSKIRRFEHSVLPIQNPTCPIDWERHTESIPAAEEETGVVWRDSDGYYCIPKGISDNHPDTLVPRPDDRRHIQMSQPELRERINDLSEDMDILLNPTDQRTQAILKRRELEKTRRAEMRKARTTAHGAIKKGKVATDTRARERENYAYERELVKIMKGMLEEDPQASAVELLETAHSCVSGKDGPGCTRIKQRVTVVDDKGIPHRVEEPVLIPSMVTDETASPALVAWWVRFRREELKRLDDSSRSGLTKFV